MKNTNYQKERKIKKNNERKSKPAATIKLQLDFQIINARLAHRKIKVNNKKAKRSFLMKK